MITRFSTLALCFCFLFILSSVGCKKKDTTSDNGNTTNVQASMASNTYASSTIGNFGYWLYTPENATEDMALIVYLHGGSGRGSNINLVTTGSLPQFLQDGSVKSSSAYVLMPQCPSNKTWEQISPAVKELIDKIVADKKINTKKISLTGHSLGGSGTWSLGKTYASVFSCIAPLSGSVDVSTASSYIGYPVWAFVGSADTIVDPVSSENIVPAINTAGGKAQIKIYPGATHFDVPTLVYKDQSVNLLDWMASQTRN